MQDITGKYQPRAGPVAGVKSNILSDGRAPWAQGGYFDSEEHDPRERKNERGRRVDKLQMIPAGGKITSVTKGN